MASIIKICDLRKVVVLPMLVALTAAGGSGSLNYTTDWWAGAVEEDAIRPLPLDGEGGLWTSSFIPPPPRPDFLDDRVTPDGLTTCDLCTWAWHERGHFFLDPTHETSGELGWVLTLAIVSILSAAVGAVVMVTVLQCRKSPDTAVPALRSVPDRDQNADGNKHVTTFDTAGSGGGGGRVWTWLTTRRTTTGPAQLCAATQNAPAENHYTMDEAYTAVGEALYAELDRELSNSPAYQNTAYNGSDTDPDAPPSSSSAPSSAYYSDLSCATGPDRTYEAVGLGLGTGTPSSSSWDTGDIALRRQQPMSRLAAITETITVPSDYV
ncbi:uncharacterized protein LOC110838190 isoform X3 [Zootermopsis nevadensis]|uniref:uncharacterized protein LOC110838190 isoform X3 n=1 Tax=Zootermopsis nevadensis TaxID=136037 RepID=UPI000B8E7279|nr:uncharacterized protein LOC110838190 isoform X3 [Zootermopsis nevadensis]